MLTTLIHCHWSSCHFKQLILVLDKFDKIIFMLPVIKINEKYAFLVILYLGNYTGK